MKASVFCGISLDGFIARPNGELDWLTGPVDDKGQEDDHGFTPFFESVDALVMGRHSFEKVMSFNEWYYGTKPVIVLTSRPLEIPPQHKATVETMSGEPADIIKKLEARGFKHLYIDGGITVQRFLRAGLINRMILSRLPVLIGQGIPLFGSLPRDIQWRLVSTKSYPGGMVQSEYEIR